LVYSIARNYKLFTDFSNLSIDEHKLNLNKDSNFIANDEWLKEWKSRIDFKTMSTLMSYLLPKLEKMAENNSNEEDVLDSLKKISIVGIIPPPNPLLIRKYHLVLKIVEKHHVFMWSIIFVNTSEKISLFDKDLIKLFVVNL